MRRYQFFLFSGLLLLTITGCSKSDDAVQPVITPPVVEKPTLSYPDSIFYVKENVNDNIVRPDKSQAGKYFGFPEGIEIDEASGAIDINKSETGLHYKIFFVPDGSNDTLESTILISGINYYDKIYNLSENDTIALPVYNGNVANEIPGANANSIFDEDRGCNNQGIAVNLGDAKINLAETVRNGVFGETPANGASIETDMVYRIDDKSGKALNKLRVKLYYFDTAADITPDLIKLIEDRRGTVFQANLHSNYGTEILSGAAGMTTTNGATAKPRPPCIFLVGR